MKMRQAIILLLFLIAGIGAFWLHGYLDKNLVVLKTGTAFTVDEVWESGGVIYYKIETEDFLISKFEVESFGKPNSKSAKQHVKFEVSRLFAKTKAECKDFVNDTSDSIAKNYRWILGILAATALGIILLLAVRLIMRFRQGPADLKHHQEPEPPEAFPLAMDESDISHLDIIQYFLTLFRLQLGADPNAPMSTRLLSKKSSEPNYIYELRIKHRKDWVKRRMTIGPLGEDSGSKSKCFYVIYDVHLVVKIPVKPITEFEDYIESIKEEGHIVDKLAPKECIIPRVSVILNLFNKRHEYAELSPDKLEEKYVDWLRANTAYQQYLKIKNTFVFFMDFSKYYFLGHIVDSLHVVEDAIPQEMVENAETVFDVQKFRGRYGKTKESIGIEIRHVYDYCQAAIRQFLTKCDAAPNVSMFRIQSWFLIHLSHKQFSSKETGLSENLAQEINRLIEDIFKKHMDAVEAYRATITEYVLRIRFEQNKPQIIGILTNLLDLLAWLREKRIAMRDLKPDNLLVAGDPSKYPLFLMHADEYELGIIDVETAVDFEKSKYHKVKQPLLGGTPFYATPSHFFSNPVLKAAFFNLNKILHLQDWYATLVMIYKTVTGELMFEQTAKLFAEIRYKIKVGQMDSQSGVDVLADVSRGFWRSALVEFQVKMDAKEDALKSIFVPIPENAKRMFKKVLVKDLQATTEKIKQRINTQTVFESPQSREQLLKSPPEKINQLRAEFENKSNHPKNTNANHTTTIVFLKYLSTLKLHVEQQKLLLKRLEQPDSKLSTYTLLGFMFNNLYKSMLREEWWAKPTADKDFSDADVDHATLEATL